MADEVGWKIGLLRSWLSACFAKNQGIRSGTRGVKHESDRCSRAASDLLQNSWNELLVALCWTGTSCWLLRDRKSPRVPVRFLNNQFLMACLIYSLTAEHLPMLHCGNVNARFVVCGKGTKEQDEFKNWFCDLGRCWSDDWCGCTARHC